MDIVSKSDYSKYNLHLALVDTLDDTGDILDGVAIPKELLGSFLVDFHVLASRYGVSFEELLENDALDTSASAASRERARHDDAPETIDAEGVAQKRLG